VLCRSLDGLRTLLAHGVRLVYADFQDVREYREAVAAARSCGAVLLLATPRIHKPGETGLFRAIARHEPDGVLVRNLAGLEFCVSHGLPALADFALNAANELTVDWLLEQGASHVTASYDLNRDQLLDLVRRAPADRLEVVVHQHMPLFHMEHCVFCAVLSPGTDATNCGRPCDRHAVRLRDRTGAEHPLHADVGCRNTLFNAAAQSGAEVVGALLERGVRRFRLEVLPETPAAEVRRTVDLYRALVEGRTTGRDVWSSLRATNRIGTTRGTLEANRDPLAIL
jgi:putative protease